MLVQTKRSVPGSIYICLFPCSGRVKGSTSWCRCPN